MSSRSRIIRALKSRLHRTLAPSGHDTRRSHTGVGRLRLEELEARLAPAVFTPTVFTDTGNSLRAAVTAANADTDPSSTINLAAGIYTLSIVGRGEDLNATGDLDVNKTTGTLMIVGQGATPANTVIDANDIDRIFHIISNTAVTFQNLTITDGLATDNGSPALSPALGGGILSNGGALTFTNVVLTGNVAQGADGLDGADGTAGTPDGGVGTPGQDAAGGGLYAAGGSLLFDNSDVTSNIASGGAGGDGGDGFDGPAAGGIGGAGGAGGSAQGGGVFAGAGVTAVTLMNGSAIDSNNAFGSSGGIGGAGGDAAAGAGGVGGAGGTGGSEQGGGLYVAAGAVSITDSSVSNNAASGGGVRVLIGLNTFRLDSAAAGGDGGAGGNGTVVGGAGGAGGTGGSAQGGGVYAGGGVTALTIANSTIDSNELAASGGGTGGDGMAGGAGGAGGASGDIQGGGVYAAAGTISITAGSTLSNNISALLSPVSSLETKVTAATAATECWSVVPGGTGGTAARRRAAAFTPVAA